MTAVLAGVGVLALLLTGCDRASNSAPAEPVTRASQQAGEPLNPVAVVGHIAAARAAALRGDRQAAAANARNLSDDFRRSIRLPDASRPINHEAARAAVASVEGVRSNVWIDPSNLLVMVADAQHRSMQTIDRVCGAMAPLGDTLAVVVNVQNVTAKTSREADTLSRNCQLPEGQRAFLQPKRRIDVLDPATRSTFEAQQHHEG